jgi:Tol biopolymer transport system component
MPADARVIFASDQPGEKDPWGLPANALYVATLDGKVTRITHSQFSHNHFSVSPNRRYIATDRYSRGDANHDGKYFPHDDWKDLWIIDTRTGQERALVPDIDAGMGGLAWSPDSKWVYFATESVTGVMDIVRVSIATQKVEVLTRNLLTRLGYKGPDRRKWVADVDLSDDGRRLVFGFRGPEMFETGKTRERIATMTVDGKEAHIVSSGGPLAAGGRGEWSVGDFDPDLAPDGRHVAFARMTDAGWITPQLSTWDIILSDLHGGHETDISKGGGLAADYIPSWGDQHLVAFTHVTKTEGRRPAVYDTRTGKTRIIDVGIDATHVQLIPWPAR